MGWPARRRSPLAGELACDLGAGSRSARGLPIALINSPGVRLGVAGQQPSSWSGRAMLICAVGLSAWFLEMLVVNGRFPAAAPGPSSAGERADRSIAGADHAGCIALAVHEARSVPWDHRAGPVDVRVLRGVDVNRPPI